MNSCLTLNGKSYPLHFSVNALCCLEEAMGKNIDALLSGSLSALRGLLWCGLMENEKGLTMDQAGQLLDAHLKAGGSLQAVSSAVAQALETACFFHPGPGKPGIQPSPAAL